MHDIKYHEKLSWYILYARGAGNAATLSPHHSSLPDDTLAHARFTMRTKNRDTEAICDVNAL